MLLASSPIREAHCTYSFCASGFTRERNTVITIATLLSCTFLELPARLFYPSAPILSFSFQPSPERIAIQIASDRPSVPPSRVYRVNFHVERLEILPV